MSFRIYNPENSLIQSIKRLDNSVNKLETNTETAIVYSGTVWPGPFLSYYTYTAFVILAKMHANMFVTLFTTRPSVGNGDAVYIPNLAETYSKVDVSPTRVTYTFNIRQNQKFVKYNTSTNSLDVIGDITSEDVKQSILNYYNTAIPPFYYPPFVEIFDTNSNPNWIRTNGVDKLEIDIVKSEELFVKIYLSNATSFGILPANVSPPPSMTNLICSGPYYVKEYTDTQIRCKNNPYHFETLQNPTWMIQEFVGDPSMGLAGQTDENLLVTKMYEGKVLAADYFDKLNAEELFDTRWLNRRQNGYVVSLQIQAFGSLWIGDSVQKLDLRKALFQACNLSQLTDDNFDPYTYKYTYNISKDVVGSPTADNSIQYNTVTANNSLNTYLTNSGLTKADINTNPSHQIQILYPEPSPWGETETVNYLTAIKNTISSVLGLDIILVSESILTYYDYIFSGNMTESMFIAAWETEYPNALSAFVQGLQWGPLVDFPPTVATYISNAKTTDETVSKANLTLAEQDILQNVNIVPLLYKTTKTVTNPTVDPIVHSNNTMSRISKGSLGVKGLDL